MYGKYFTLFIDIKHVRGSSCRVFTFQPIVFAPSISTHIIKVIPTPTEYHRPSHLSIPTFVYCKCSAVILSNVPCQYNQFLPYSTDHIVHVYANSKLQKKEKEKKKECLRCPEETKIKTVAWKRFENTVLNRVHGSRTILPEFNGCFLSMIPFFSLCSFRFY